MRELPKLIQRNIYRDFLFTDFIYNFGAHFRLIKEDTLGNRQTMYNWDDNQFQ